MIDQIVNYNVAELTRHFGAIVGTTGVDDEVKKACNTHLLKLVKCLEVNVDKAVQENQSSNSGLIK